MDVNQIYCGNYFIIYVSQMMLSVHLKLIQSVCQFYINKTERKKKLFEVGIWPLCIYKFL